jgi:alpha-L-arabinofuranosidase
MPMFAATLAAAADTTMTVHVDRPGVKVSPMLYGIFFEEINRAGEGGLYGEMLQNRSFEDDRGDRDNKPTKACGWRLVKEGDAGAKMSIDSSMPLGANNPNSLRLDIVSGGKPAGVANEGFRGIAVKAGESYQLSLFARTGGGLRGPLIASLENKDGAVLASTTIDAINGEWKPYRATLTVKETSTSARLVLAVKSSGTLWLDEVSLFPTKTFKGRHNGLRPDLAEMLVELKPAFNRFPGGCYVEGNRLDNAFRWKKSIGDPAERPGHWNLWGYRSTGGLGYHEYLQLCEDLGAAPLFVINCGMAHEDHVAHDKLDEWVQDALDAIEYANGPPDGKWGALRAKAGHPAPFHLKYMEIGNENGGPVYEDHYRHFYDRIKAKYPDMTLVANTLVRSRPMDILDEHYYSNPEFFMANAERYDKYDRTKGPKIYVGEYAVTQNCGKGNLRAAIGEAAFMTGMERNSDIVAMASYAPLLVNCGWRQWNPNAINFDCSRVYGTPSYYVQKMFSRNRADVVLGLDFAPPEVKSADSKIKGGAIGVGTWATRAEYKDIKVTRGDKVLFRQTTGNDMNGWTPVAGQWSMSNGVLRQSALHENLRCFAGDTAWKDYTYTLKARKLGGAEGFLISFNVQNHDAKSWWNLGGWGNQRHALEMDGVSDSGVPGQIETGRWYDIRIETAGGRIRCYLDGKLVHDVRRGSLPSMYAVAGRAGSDVVLKVANQVDTPQTVQVALEGLKGKVVSGTASVLTSASQQDENSLSEPGKVVPIERPIAGAGERFAYTFPAGSVTVLRLKLQE